MSEGASDRCDSNADDWPISIEPPPASGSIYGRLLGDHDPIANLYPRVDELSVFMAQSHAAM